MKLRVLHCALICAICSSAPAWAVDNPTLTFRGSEHQPIPLNASQPVEITADGNIEATCIFQTGNPTRCVNIGTQTTGNVPQATLTTSAPLAEGSTTVYAVTAGQQFTVTRTVTNNPVFCQPSVSAGAQVSGWATVPASNGTSTLSINSEGNVTIGLRCFNETGAPESPTQLSFQVAAAVGPNPANCPLIDQGVTHPLLQPPAFTRFVRSWQQVFAGRSPFNGPSHPMPVGSYTVTLNPNNSPPSAGMYISVPVTLPANSTLTIFSTDVTGTYPPEINYSIVRQGSMFVSLSPCAGDLRPREATNMTDTFLRACRGVIREGQLSFSTIPPGTSLGCRIPAGEYWLNFSSVDPDALMQAPEATRTSLNACATQTPDPAARCEVGITPSFTTF